MCISMYKDVYIRISMYKYIQAYIYINIHVCKDRKICLHVYRYVFDRFRSGNTIKHTRAPARVLARVKAEATFVKKNTTFQRLRSKVCLKP